MTRASFDAQRGPDGALLIGSPDEVVDKILRHAEALGGISRISFQMNVAAAAGKDDARDRRDWGGRGAHVTSSGLDENDARAAVERRGIADNGRCALADG